MSESTRIDEFKADVADLQLKTGKAGTERLLQIAGAVLMVIGIALAVIAYANSTDQIHPGDQNESIILALTGVAVTIVGGAMFLRYSLGRFMRFWLLRQLYEGQANTEALKEAVRGMD